MLIIVLCTPRASLGRRICFPEMKGLCNIENCGLVAHGWQTGYSGLHVGMTLHQNTNVPQRPGRMSFVRTCVDFQGVPAKNNIMSGIEYNGKTGEFLG